MNHQNDGRLERDLAMLSQWGGASPEPWRGADRIHHGRAAKLSRAVLRPSGFASLAAAVVLMVGVAAAWLGGAGGAGGDSTPHAVGGSGAALSSQAAGGPVQRIPRSGGSLNANQDAVAAARPARAAFDAAAAGAPASAAAFASERMVARRASVELVVGDVPTTVQRLSELVVEARGEYVQESLIGGEGGGRNAAVTLRVAGDRHAQVLARIRELGKVERESSGGEDVTDRVFDLEARLRNERRFEEELLRLSESRANAPLEDILKLRERVGQVRESIERLQAQRDGLARMVSLSTIVVSVRPGESSAAEAPAAEGRFGRSWDRGLATLERSAARLLEVLVGGLLWWIALGSVAWFIGRTVARSMRGSAAEPPPKL